MGSRIPSSDEGESSAQIKELCRKIYYPGNQDEIDEVTALDADAIKQKLTRYTRKLLVEAHRQTVDDLVERFKTIAPKNGTPAELEAFVTRQDDRILEIQNQLALTYTNVNAELQSQLKNLAGRQIDEAYPDDRREKVPGAVRIRGLIAKRIQESLDEVNVAAGRTRQNAEIFTELREGLGKRINAALFEDWKYTVDDLLVRVAHGNHTVSEIRWDKGMFRSGERQKSADETFEDLRTLESFGEFLGWSENRHAEFFKDYLEGDPPLGIAYLQHLHNVMDPSSMKPQYFRYTEESGRVVTVAIEPTAMEVGRSLGILTFQAAMKGYSIWNDVNDGRTMFNKLNEVFSGTLSDAERRRAHSEILTAALGLSDYLSLTKYFSRFRYDNQWLGLGGTLATACSLAGSETLGDEEFQLLLFALVKDASLHYMPQLGVVLALHGIAEWGWNAHNLSAAESDLIDLLVENGEWNFEAAKSDLSGKVPELSGVYFDKKTKILRPVKDVARMLPERFKDGIEIVKTVDGKDEVVKTVRNPRESLLEIAYQSYLPNDPMLKLTERAAGNYTVLYGTATAFQQLNSPRNWTRPLVESLLRIKYPNGFDEDSLALPFDSTKPSTRIVSTGEVSGQFVAGVQSNYMTQLDFQSGARKALGYQIADYWVKRQNLLEGPVLDAIVKEATRRKWKEDRIEANAAGYLDELLVVFDRVENIDEKLWPLVADSAKPFEPQMSSPAVPDATPFRAGEKTTATTAHPALNWRPGPELPIARRFLKETESLRATLAEYVLWLNDPSQTKTALTEERVTQRFNTPERRAREPLTDEQVREKAGELMARLVDEAYALETIYDGVISDLNLVDELVREGDGFSLRPWFHIGLNPQPNNVSPVISADPDSKRTTEWRDQYKQEPVRVEDDIAQLLRQLEGKGLLERTLNAWGYNWVAGEENVAARSHPYWTRLLRLRYQIRKLENISIFVEKLTPQELTWAVREKMLLEGQPVQVAEDIAYPLGARSWIRGDLIPALEAEYDRLLLGVQNVFKVGFDTRRVPEGRPFKVWSLLEAHVDIELENPSAFLNPVSHVPGDRPAVDEGIDSAAQERNLLENLVKSRIHQVVWEVRRPDQSLYFSKKYTTKKIQPSMEWLCPLMESGKFFVQANLFGTDDLLLGEGKTSITVEPAELKGRVAVRGDWPPGEIDRVEIVAEGTVIGEVDLPEGRDPAAPLNLPVKNLWKDLSSFKNIDLERLRDGFYVDFGATARVGVTESEPVTITANGPGLLEMRPGEALELELFYKADVEVTVTDAAQMRTPAKITLLQNGVALEAVSPRELVDYHKITLEFQMENTAGAHARIQALQPPIESEAAPVPFDPKTHGTIPLTLELPFFDAGHLEITGRLAPSTGRSLTPIKGGQVGANLFEAASVDPDGRFRSRNDHAWPLDKPLLLHGVLWDEEGRVFRTAGSKVERRLEAGPLVDLGVIPVEPHAVAVEPFRIQVKDWAGRRVDPGQIRVTVGDRPASWNGDQFEGAWRFTKIGETIRIRAELAMPDGVPAVAEDVYAIDLDSFTSDEVDLPPPFELRVPVYTQFTIQVANQLNTPAGKTPPLYVNVNEGASDGSDFPVGQTVLGNQTESVTLRVPVRVRADNGQPNQVTLRATAEEDGIRYSGEAAVTVPQQPSRASMLIHLTTDGPVVAIVPDVEGLPAMTAADRIGEAQLRPEPGDAGPAPTPGQAFTVKKQVPERGTELSFRSPVTIEIYGAFDVHTALQNAACPPDRVAAWNEMMARVECRCPEGWISNGSGGCVDPVQEQHRRRCDELKGALMAASRVGDLNQYAILLSQALDCSFYSDAQGWLQNEICKQLQAALMAASQAGDLDRFRELLSQAVGCSFYSDALAWLNAAQQSQDPRRPVDLFRDPPPNLPPQDQEDPPHDAPPESTTNPGLEGLWEYGDAGFYIAVRVKYDDLLQCYTGTLERNGIRDAYGNVSRRVSQYQQGEVIWTSIRALPGQPGRFRGEQNEYDGNGNVLPNSVIYWVVKSNNTLQYTNNDSGQILNFTKTR